MPLDHDVPEEPAPAPPPLRAAEPGARRSAAEEARTLVAGRNVGTLATLSADGHPWGSLVAYGTLHDGAPVLFVSRLAEHRRNLDRDGRASLVVAQADSGSDPLAAGRVTLAGVAERPAGERAAAAAREAYAAAVPTARMYESFGDFALWVLWVQRIRWVGGYGRMDSASGDAYAAAEPDPTAAAAPGAIAHLNDDHADALLTMARALAGHTDATAATCTGIDRYGLDLAIATPRGHASARVGYAEPVSAPGGLRAATVELARRARAALAPTG